MVSRRKILSRSRDDLHMDSTFQQPEDEEDVWYQKDKLYKVSDDYYVLRGQTGCYYCNFRIKFTKVVFIFGDEAFYVKLVASRCAMIVAFLQKYLGNSI